ncbi:MAG: hypothetical protein IKF17_06100 [Clostridia bacterium]|nr:hypothetical protein [Clostridia bacterium]
MKKFIVIFIIATISILALIYGYFNFEFERKNIAKENLKFEYCYNKEIYGAELATIINRAIENNEKNNISKDNKGFYIENEQNSIKIEIKIIDNNTTYKMETFYMNDITKFVQNFNTIKFKCTKIEYHSQTGKIKYLYFEQISS